MKGNKYQTHRPFAREGAFSSVLLDSLHTARISWLSSNSFMQSETRYEYGHPRGLSHQMKQRRDYFSFHHHWSVNTSMCPAALEACLGKGSSMSECRDALAR